MSAGLSPPTPYVRTGDVPKIRTLGTLMIVQGALDVALGTAPAHFVVFEEDVHFAIGSTQLHAFNSPGTLYA